MTRKSTVILGTLAFVAVVGYSFSHGGGTTNTHPTTATPSDAGTNTGTDTGTGTNTGAGSGPANSSPSDSRPSQPSIEARLARLEDQVRMLQAKTGLTNNETIVHTAEPESPLLPPTDDTPIYPISFVPDGSEIDDPFLGKTDAPIVIMAFSNYSCRTCDRFFQDTFPSLKKESIDSGKVRLILRDLPVNRNGSADTFSIAANCAGAQGKYWEAHEALLKRKKSDSDPQKLFKSISGLNLERLNKCSANTRYEREISGDIADAKRLGATGAPSFFIGKREGSFLKGVFLRGAQPLSLFRSQIAKLR